MIDTDLVDDVRTSITTDPDRFSERVDREAERLKDGVREGTFDNSRAIVGLEYEFYGVDRETTALRRVPRWLLRFLAFGEEMGLYNAELNTSPQSLNSYGLTAQQREVQARLAAARVAANRGDRTRQRRTLLESHPRGIARLDIAWYRTSGLTFVEM